MRSLVIPNSNVFPRGALTGKFPRPQLPQNEASTTQESPVPWSLAKRVLFRFTFLYLLLYTLPILIYYTALYAANYGWMAPAEYVYTPMVEFLDSVVGWIAQHVFHLELVMMPSTSINIDSYAGLIQLLCYATLAAITTVLWSVLDWKRPRYTWLHDASRAYIRFALAIPMLLYGAIKLIKSQWGDPTLETLITPFGELRPADVMFSFMSVSTPYTMILGAVEMIGALLLLSRRTTLLGAVICMAAMVQVVLLNVFYMVAVKLFASHLLLMALVLAAPDLRRLFCLFVLNRAVPSAVIRPLFTRKWLHYGAFVLRTVLIVGFAGIALHESYKTATTLGYLRPTPPLYGIWEVQELRINGQVRPPLVTDPMAWRRVVLNQPSMMIQHWKETSETGHIYMMEVNVEQRTIVLSRFEDPTWTATLTYSEPAAGQLVLHGMLDGKEVNITLQRMDESRLPLNGPYRWFKP